MIKANNIVNKTIIQIYRNKNLSAADSNECVQQKHEM